MLWSGSSVDDHGNKQQGQVEQWNKAAWKVYKFSLLYLALLFVAMVIDRRI